MVEAMPRNARIERNGCQEQANQIKKIEDYVDILIEFLGLAAANSCNRCRSLLTPRKSCNRHPRVFEMPEGCQTGIVARDARLLKELQNSGLRAEDRGDGKNRGRGGRYYLSPHHDDPPTRFIHGNSQSFIADRLISGMIR